jgi:hypothetical protein
MIASSWLLPRVGSRRIVQVALVGYCAAGPLVGLTGSLPALFAALFVWARSRAPSMWRVSLPVALGLLPLLTAFLVAGTLSSRTLRRRQP